MRIRIERRNLEGGGKEEEEVKEDEEEEKEEEEEEELLYIHFIPSLLMIFDILCKDVCKCALYKKLNVYTNTQ